MNKLLLLILGGLMLISVGLQAQENKTLPTTEVETLEGQKVSTADFDNDGKPMVISFWATWCKPCIKELKAIHDLYPDWQDETGVKVVAISIDDARNAGQVPTLVNAFGWEYEVYLDKNSDFKRAMNVVNIPHTFLIDGEGKIVYQHTSYAPGDEEELYDKILELVEAAGK
ncbi:MAG: TlpA family protein disulfide reductase [Bacteroidia bacterium]